jgi:arginyl-tRNA synthetase
MHDQMRKNEEKYAGIDDPEGTSREIGITAIKIQDMQAKRCVSFYLFTSLHAEPTARRINNYTFNWDRMKSFEGDTGPYLQYAHVRLSSMARRNPQLHPLPPAEQINTDLLVEPKVSARFLLFYLRLPASDLFCIQAREIMILLASYPDIVKTAMKTREPSGVVTYMFKCVRVPPTCPAPFSNEVSYLFRLSHAISGAWEVMPVKGEADIEKARARMFMFICAQDVLGAAMRLLSIRPLERM